MQIGISYTRARVAHATVLLGIVAGAAILRLHTLAEPSLWLDEILGYDLTTAAMSRPLFSWLTGFGEEHGPLYYATQLIGRAWPGPELASRVVPAFLGIATIVAVWVAGRMAGSDLTGIAAAAILAASPLHVYYSREGRPYALTMLLAAVLLVALLRNSRAVYALIIATLYTSAIAAPLIATVALIGAVARRWRVAIVSVAALAVVPLLYRGADTRNTGVDFPDVGVRLFETIVRAFGVSATGSAEKGRTAWIILALAVGGAIALMRTDRRRGLIVVAMAVLPTVIALIALSATDHWFAIRYLCAALPAYVVLAACGIDLLGQAVARFRLRAVVVVAVTMAIVAQTIPAAAREPHRKLDWRVVAATVWSHAHQGDVIVTAEQWSAVSLGFYLRRLPQRVRLAHARVPEIAESFVKKYQRAWLVSAGYSTDTRVRDWMCAYPVVLSSRLEDLRVHYAPTLSDFLRERSLVHERRAIVSAVGTNGLTLHMGRESDIFLSRGWAQPEGTGRDAFRWAMDGAASVTLPFFTAVDREIRLTVSPLVHKGLPPQMMRISVNGLVVEEMSLSAGSHEYLVAVPARRWSTERNVLDIHFSRANAPAELNPALTDPRRLSAAFDTITIAERGSSVAMADAGAPRVRLRELRENSPAAPLDQRTAWRGFETRFDGASLDRQRTEKLIARAGFDPATVWQQIARGHTSLEALMETLATSSSCEDDTAFIHGVWRVIFEREPNRIEGQVLMSLLRRSGSRVAFMQRIVRMDEFRRAVSRERVV